MVNEELVPVRVRDCPDGTHPDGDVVMLHPTISLEGGMAASLDAADCGIGTPDFDGKALVRRWMVTFCRYGPASWTLHDPGGEAWPLDPDRLMADYALAWPVADRADDLYRESVMGPLGLGLSPTSQAGQAAATTSPRSTSTRRPRASSSQRRSDGVPSGVPTG